MPNFQLDRIHSPLLLGIPLVNQRLKSCVVLFPILFTPTTQHHYPIAAMLFDM